MIDAFKIEFKFPWETMVNDLLRYSVQRQYTALINGFAGGQRLMLDVAVPRLDSGRQSGISTVAFDIAKKYGYYLIIAENRHAEHQETKIDKDKLHTIKGLINHDDGRYIGVRFKDVRGVIVDASAMDKYTSIDINNAIYRLVKDNNDKVIPMVILG